MAKWDVELFMCGTVHVVVEAATEEEARKKARNCRSTDLRRPEIDELYEVFEITPLDEKGN
jgi:hypothetical protein